MGVLRLCEGAVIGVGGVGVLTKGVGLSCGEYVRLKFEGGVQFVAARNEVVGEDEDGEGLVLFEDVHDVSLGMVSRMLRASVDMSRTWSIKWGICMDMTWRKPSMVSWLRRICSGSSEKLTSRKAPRV